MTQTDVNKVFNQRSKALALHELDTVFGTPNALSDHFKLTGEIQVTMLARALLRQQYHTTKRIERIEEKLGMKWDPLSLDPGYKKP